MAKTPSTMLPLGTLAPPFTLPDVVSGHPITLPSVKPAVATVIMFICNHCPYVKYVNQKLIQLANDFIPKGVKFLAISSNDADNYPDDSPENMKKSANELGYPFPYLYDENQEVARAYQAACTPDFYVFDANLLLIYRGQLDDSRPGNDEEDEYRNSLRATLDSLLLNQPIASNQKPSIGCNIKWKQQPDI